MNKAAVTELWERGTLFWKLFDYQMPLYNAIQAALDDEDCKKFVVNISRQWGKSFTFCIVAIEFALRHPGAQIRYAAPTLKTLKKVVTPHFRQILEDAPASCRPVFKAHDAVWEFPNGSEIHVAGTDSGNAEDLRGTRSDLNLIDECGFMDDLGYILSSILIPQTLTTKGKTLMTSTPPSSPGHEYVEIAREAEINGHYFKRTIWDNTRLTQKDRDILAKESGGYDSDTWKREHEAEFVIDSSLAIIPEWRPEMVKEPEVNSLTPYWHRYVAMDLGTKDFTAVLFGYWDFQKACLVIEDELHMNGPEMTTDILSAKIKQKEKELWRGAAPYRRISDNNDATTLNTLAVTHQLPFMATNKESLQAMVNAVRILVNQGGLIVHPRCEMLARDLKNGIFKKDRSEFARINGHGHFDHLAALIYLVRNLDTVSNPVPHGLGISTLTHHVKTTKNPSSNVNSILKILNLRK